MGDCVDSYMATGLTRTESEKLCAEMGNRDPKGPVGPVGPLSVLRKRAYFSPSKNNGSLVPVGRVTSRASVREQSMAAAGGLGWRLRTGYMGSGAVVYPDTDEEAKAFLKSLGRPLKDSDRNGWTVYAGRIGMAPMAIDRAWKMMTKPQLRPGLAETLAEIRSVFEATSWWGYSVPHIFQTGDTRQGPVQPQTPVSVHTPKIKHEPVQPVMSPPSFPFHTKSAGNVWAQAQKLIRQMPLANSTEILKRSISSVEANPITDLTPEDEKLLRIAIEFAQNGPAGQPNKIGGMPGGPFRSGAKTRGAP